MLYEIQPTGPARRLATQQVGYYQNGKSAVQRHKCDYTRNLKNGSHRCLSTFIAFGRKPSYSCHMNAYISCLMSLMHCLNHPQFDSSNTFSNKLWVIEFSFESWERPHLKELTQFFTNVLFPCVFPAMLNHPPVPITDLAQHVGNLRANDGARFSLEYESIDPGQQFTWDASNLEINKPKNRYANVIAYDHSRVLLQPIDGIVGSDYINANYMDGFRKQCAYIATQVCLIFLFSTLFSFLLQLSQLFLLSDCLVFFVKFLFVSYIVNSNLFNLPMKFLKWPVCTLIDRVHCLTLSVISGGWSGNNARQLSSWWLSSKNEVE